MVIVAFAIALASGQAATAETAPAKEKKICRTVANTGSIMGTRICHSKADWAAIDAANQNAMDQYHDRSVGRSGAEGARS